MNYPIKTEFYFTEDGLPCFGKLNDKIDVTVKGTYTQDDKADFTIDYKTPDDGIDRIPVITNSDFDETQDQDRRVFQNEDVFFKRKNYGTVGKVNVQLDKVHELTSITSYNYSESSFLRDFDASTASVGTFGKASDLSTITQEIRVATPRENRKFFYIGGLFFLNEKLNNSDTLRGRGRHCANLGKRYFSTNRNER